MVDMPACLPAFKDSAIIDTKNKKFLPLKPHQWVV
jgi:hypothetical protein